MFHIKIPLPKQFRRKTKFVHLLDCKADWGPALVGEEVIIALTTPDDFLGEVPERTMIVILELDPPREGRRTRQKPANEKPCPAPVRSVP